MDRQECDCLNDCEMVHNFATLQREPFLGSTAEVRAQEWFDPDTQSGRLFHYLVDPNDYFSDKLTKGIAALAHNLSDAGIFGFDSS